MEGVCIVGKGYICEYCGEWVEGSHKCYRSDRNLTDMMTDIDRDIKEIKDRLSIIEYILKTLQKTVFE